MKILVAGAMHETALDELRALGSTVEYAPEISAAQLPERIAEAGILIIGRTRVSPAAIEKGVTLQMIVRLGTAVSNVAIDEASQQGVFVVNCPDMDAEAVAEMTIGFILALDRRLIRNADALRAKRAERDAAPSAHGLVGRTIGILDYNRVGQELARRARAFRMKVLAWTRHPSAGESDNEEVEFCAGPRELARRSDIVTVYAPPAQADELLVDAEFLQNMRDGAYLVHVGHPAAIDEAALAEAARTRHLRVALDIYAPELTRDSARFRSSLLDIPGVIGTHHLADQTKQAERATADEAVRVVREFLVAGKVCNCVNVAERSPATWLLVLRLRDAVGVMASVMNAILADGINAEEITSRVFNGARAAWCTIALNERPSTEALDAVRSLDDVIHLELRAVL